MYVLFEKAGEETRKKKADRPSPLEFRLLRAFLKHTSDPEKGLADFGDGVRVGVGFKLPRVLAVYPRKLRVRDQDKSPAAQDIKRVLRQLAERPGPKFGFKVDVQGAHRLIPVSPQDWHLLACRSDRTEQVYINVTGTICVAGTAYWWSRVATAAVRGPHHVLGPEIRSKKNTHTQTNFLAARDFFLTMYEVHSFFYGCCKHAHIAQEAHDHVRDAFK